MVGDVAFARTDEVATVTVADGALLTQLIFDVEIDT